MGEAREVMDRLTHAIERGDWDTFAACYAEDAVAVTPDEGEVKGRENIVEYMRKFQVALPDFQWESLQAHECGNVAVDEGWVVGTNTGPLPTPTGETIPATGRSLRIRGCDLATVENGQVVSHRFYFDQMEFLGQLGLSQ